MEMSLRQWVLKQAALFKEVEEHVSFSSKIKLCDPYTCGVHVYKGLERMAEAVDADVYVNNRGNRAFVCDGVEFFTLD